MEYDTNVKNIQEITIPVILNLAVVVTKKLIREFKSLEKFVSVQDKMSSKYLKIKVFCCIQRIVSYNLKCVSI